MRVFILKPILSTMFALFLFQPLASADFSGYAGSLAESVAYNVASGLMTKSLVKAMLTPCREELGPLNPANIYHCYRASKSFGKALDIKIAAQGLLAFSSEMAQLMASPETLTYLRDLVIYYTPKEEEKGQIRLNRQKLWDWTLAHPVSQRSEAKALQLIAVLFQDTNGYGEGFIRVSLLQSGLEQHDQAHRLLIDALEIVKTQFSAPAELNMDTEGINNFKLYHFYVIAYAAYKVTKDIDDPRYGFMLPFLMNRGYEFISIRMGEYSDAISKDLPGEVGPGFQTFLRFFINSPPVKSKDLRKSFDSNFLGDATHDIYLGYRGAMLGASIGAGKRLSTLTRIEFEEAFTRSPFDFTALAMSLIENEL